MDHWQLTGIICAVISQLVTIFGTWFIVWKTNHSKKKWLQEQISCKKREIWDIQKQITSIACSGDKKLLKSDYVNQLCEKLKSLKREIADLNSHLKPKDKDTTKLNVTESIKMIQDTLKGNK